MHRLRLVDSLLLGSLTFGLFFGAGNLIFPMSLGLQAGAHVLPAAAGFLVAAVGLPIVGVIASATSGTTSLHQLASRVHPLFATIFTCALYLTIGPFFAIPRTATVSYEMAFGGLVDGASDRWALAAFSIAFFGVVGYFALRPGRILHIVGKYLTPTFLVLLGIFLLVAFLQPPNPSAEPIGAYATTAASQGILDGYNTMDALASLAFAIIIIDAARQLGVAGTRRTAAEIGRAGIFAAIAMGAIYLALAMLGSRSVGLVPQDANGAEALALVANAVFGPLGRLLAALIMLLACLKTAIGLVVAASQMFTTMFPRIGNQRRWAVAFTLVSLLMANLGLDTIIAAAVPVLAMLYPMAIVLIILGLLAKWVAPWHTAHWLSMLLAGIASLLTVLVDSNLLAPGRWTALLPGFDLGFGWVIPAAVGLLVGSVISCAASSKRSRAPQSMS